VPAQTPRTQTLRTRNGIGVRTAHGWVWLCDLCSVTAQLGVDPDQPGFDPRRWVDSVDATHYCWHKGEGAA
jgi:hypothetical protein